MKGDYIVSTNINVNVNGKTITIKLGEKIDEIKKKFGDNADTIFDGVDENSNGTLDDAELNKLKANLKDNNYTVDLAADGKTPRGAYNSAMQNLRESYDADKLGGFFRKEDADKHTVKKGETLYTIAKKQLEEEGLPTDFRSVNNRIAQIANLNNINDVNNIEVGTQLVIKLTDDAITKVKEKEGNSAAAFNGSTERVDGDDWTERGVRDVSDEGDDEVVAQDDANHGIDPNYKKKKTAVDGKKSSISITDNGVNMGKGVPVDKEGNVLKDFKDSKFKQGGCIMKYTNKNHDPETMFQMTFGANCPYPIFRNVKLSADSIDKLKDLEAELWKIAGNIKSDRGAKETPEVKAKRQATGLANLKLLIEKSGGNEQIVSNAAALLQSDKYLNIESEECKAFAKDLLLTRNANVVKSMTTDDKGEVTMSAFKKNDEAHETLAGLYQEIREDEIKGIKLTDDQVDLKNVLANTKFKEGFKIEADKAKGVNEKYLQYGNDGGLHYKTTVGDNNYWASTEKTLDDFVNELKLAKTDEAKAELFKKYANTKDVELANCLLCQAKVLKAKDEDIKTVINANGMYVLSKLDSSADPDWSDDIKNAMLARIKDIYTKEKGNLENAGWLNVANDWINKLPEEQRKAARTEIAETYLTKDDDGNYTFNPKRRPTYEEMSKLCNLVIANEDMQKALINYTKLEDMGKGQYNDAMENSFYNHSENIASHYADMVENMTEKDEVLDFIDNKIATDRLFYLPYDKILDKFPEDKDIKDKLLSYVYSGGEISDENRLALAKTYMKEENGKISFDKTKLPKGATAQNILKALPEDCNTGEAAKYFTAVLKELGKGDLDTLKGLTDRNDKAVKARLAELVKANMTDKAFIQKVCELDSSITPYQALYEVDAKNAGWDDKTKEAVFKKIFNGRKSKDYIKGAVEKHLIKHSSINGDSHKNRYVIGNTEYSLNTDKSGNVTLRKINSDGQKYGVKMHKQVWGPGSGKIGGYLNSLNLTDKADNEQYAIKDQIASIICGFNDCSPKEGMMQYIANESKNFSQVRCNYVAKALLAKAADVELGNTNEYKALQDFVNKHNSATNGYTEEEGKQLDALLNALANKVLEKF